MDDANAYDELIDALASQSGLTSPTGALADLLVWIRQGHNPELVARAVRALRHYDASRGGEAARDVIRAFQLGRERSFAEFLQRLAGALEQYALDEGGEAGA